MRTEQIRETVNRICTTLGDTMLHRWTEIYGLSIDWLESPKDITGGIGAIEKLEITEEGRVFIPEGFLVNRVGKNVSGSFSPLLRNPNMIYEIDCCGAFVAPDTGSPDYPPYSMGGNPQMPWGDNWFGCDNWFDRGLPYHPGQGGGQSVFGYYNFSPREDFIFFDAVARGQNTHILLEGTYPTFVPRKITYINKLVVPAITAWCRYESLLLDSKVFPRLRADAATEQRIYSMEMSNLAVNINAEPLCVMIAATQAHYGQIGI